MYAKVYGGEFYVDLAAFEQKLINGKKVLTLSGNVQTIGASQLILASSTPDSDKLMKITVTDDGVITATEYDPQLDK